MLVPNFERLERLLDPWWEFRHLDTDSSNDYPVVNVWLNGDDAELTTELPGVKPEDIDISVVDKSVTLHGSRKADELHNEKLYHRRERWSGDFTKSIDLPFRVDAEKVNARFNKGVLYISLPRVEVDKPRKIKISS